MRSFLALLVANNIRQLHDAKLFKDAPNDAQPFWPHYREHILPQLQPFEEKRVETLRNTRRRSLVSIPSITAIIALAIYTFATFPLSENQSEFLLFVTAACVGGLIFWASNPARTYKASIKSTIFPHVFSFFGPDYRYSSTRGIDMQSLEGSEIIPYYETASTEDHITGNYAGVQLEFSEAKLTKTQGSGKRRRTVTVFKGMFILLDMNKNFSGKTIVKKDSGIIGNWFNNQFAKMQNVKLEDPVFEKQFEVYSTDQVQARYLLTTSFMERLLELTKLLEASGVQCSFYDSKLLLMIASKRNRFEPSSIYEPATFADDITHILAEMRVIFSMIDILKLNQRTGL